MNSEITIEKKVLQLESGKGLIAIAKAGDEFKGVCSIMIGKSGEIIYAYIESRESNRGIPRMLIEFIEQEVQREANSRGTEIFYSSDFASKNAAKKLSRIFREMGYTLKNNTSEYGGVSKTYFPQK